MELTTTRIPMERERGEASVQATFDEVYNLPDYLPDLFSVILADAEVQVDETKCGAGHVTARGEIRYRVLYRTE